MSAQSNVVSLPSIMPAGRSCMKCGEEKTWDQFYKSKTRYSSYGHTSRCKECTKEDARSRNGTHKLNPELSAARRKRAYEKMKTNPARLRKHRKMKNEWNRSDAYYERYYQRRFGISLAEVISMMARQNGLCANVGCSRELSIMGKQRDKSKSQGAVDHCHATGLVRAIMCVRCNAMLGHIEKNAQLVPGLMDYLNKYGKK